MAGTSEIRPATVQEAREVRWYPAVRTSKPKNNPVLDKLLEVLQTSPVAVIDVKQAGITSQEQIRRYARQRGTFLNTVYDSNFRSIFVRKDPDLHSAEE